MREAFLRLSAEGWMKLYPKRGALVVPIGEQEARDVVDARVVIESHAAGSVVGHPARLADLTARLAENLTAHRTTDPADAAEFAGLDAQFHQLIVAAGDNALLGDFYVSLGERQRRMTAARLGRGLGVVDVILGDHEALAKTLADGDADGFSQLLVDHLHRVHGEGGTR